MWTKLKAKLNEWYEGLKAWFHNSETIFYARMSALVGLATAAFGSLDMAPLWSLFGTGTAFTFKQVAWIGGLLLTQGVVLEIIRRRNAPELKK